MSLIPINPSVLARAILEAIAAGDVAAQTVIKNELAKLSPSLQDMALVDLTQSLQTLSPADLARAAAIVSYTPSSVVGVAKHQDPAKLGGKLKFGGKEVKVETKKGGAKIYPLIDAPARERVRLKNYIIQQATGNFQGVLTKLVGQLPPERVPILHAHLDGMISGEIGAPLEKREVAVQYIAKSPAHAEAYILQVSADGQLSGVLTASLPIVPNLKNLPKEGYVPVGVAPIAITKQAQQRHVEASDNLRDMLTRLDGLRSSQRAKWTELAVENPAVFGDEAIHQILSVARVLNHISSMREAVLESHKGASKEEMPDVATFVQQSLNPTTVGDRMREQYRLNQEIGSYIVSMEASGDIPKGYTTTSGDTTEKQVDLLFKRVQGALMTVFQAFEALKGMQSGHDRTSLAAQIDSVDDLLEHGPLGGDAAVERLSKQGVLIAPEQGAGLGSGDDSK